MRFLVFIFLASCSFRSPPAKVIDRPSPPDKGEPASISWEEIKEAMGYCKQNGKVKRIYVTGKLICGNSARFNLVRKENKK